MSYLSTLSGLSEAHLVAFCGDVSFPVGRARNCTSIWDFGFASVSTSGVYIRKLEQACLPKYMYACLSVCVCVRSQLCAEIYGRKTRAGVEDEAVFQSLLRVALLLAALAHRASGFVVGSPGTSCFSAIQSQTQ